MRRIKTAEIQRIGDQMIQNDIVKVIQLLHIIIVIIIIIIIGSTALRGPWPSSEASAS
jgi:hypothetical protein